MADNDPVIVGAARTAIGKFMGSLSSFPAPQLGAFAIKEAVKRAGIDPALVEEVIMGNVVQAAVGQAPARQAALKAGLSPESGAMTINKVCGSGLKSVMLASQAIKLGEADVIVAGGMESMSNTPFMLTQARNGYRMGHGQLLDSMVADGLWCTFGNYHMGVAAEFIAKKFGVTREDQDKYAVESHMKAVKAIKEGKFKSEIVTVEIPQRKGDPVRFDTDESPRGDTTVEALSKLKPAFDKQGTVTAGNAPGVNDGGAAVVVMSLKKARELGAKPIARVIDYATGGTTPEMLFYAPVVAVNKLLQKMGKKIDYFDLIEANEAFSAQSLVDGRELGWDWSKVNVNGGAVALGHPIGASGARILVTLLHEMNARKAKTGLATLCLGGGNAVALAVERME